MSLIASTDAIYAHKGEEVRDAIRCHQASFQKTGFKNQGVWQKFGPTPAPRFLGRWKRNRGGEVEMMGGGKTM